MYVLHKHFGLQRDIIFSLIPVFIEYGGKICYTVFRKGKGAEHMKAVTGWSFRPYTELYKPERGINPYITRLAPRENGFRAEFIDNGAAHARHSVYLRKRGADQFIAYPVEYDLFFDTDGLSANTDYEVYVEREDGSKSSVRLVRCGYVPGKVINYLHPEDEEYAFSGQYLCSPSLIRLPSGRLLSSMDVFKGEAPQNLTLVYCSDDNGETWQYLTELFPCFWGKMFLSGGKLYMLSTSNEYGDILIGRSDDDGRTWTKPTVLFRGAANPKECGLHRAPMPVIHYNGRVMTDVQYGAWNRRVMTDAVLSAPEGSDLLDAENWVVSEFWKTADSAETRNETAIGGIEGSLVVTPEGEVCDFLRFEDGKWLMLGYDPEDPEGKLVFSGFSYLPATTSKADVLFDEKSGYYVTVASCYLTEPVTRRNLLSLMYSKDLVNWRIAKHLIDYRHADKDMVGFQYVSFLIDGEDILYQSRTAFGYAHNFHDSNYATFHRIHSFREYFE